MRLFVRLLVMLGLLLSAAAVTPLAAADPSGSAPPSTDTSSSASATPSPAAPSTGTGDPSDSASPEPTAPTRGDASPSAGSPAPRALAAASVPATTIGDHPVSTTTSHSASFTFSAPMVGVSFECRLTGPGRTARNFSDCGFGVPAGADRSTGSMSYDSLDSGANAYTFEVRAYVLDPTDASGRRTGAADSFDWHVYSVYAPSDYVPGTGATFNNPLGNRTATRKNLTRVIHAVNSMPGYREPASKGAPCPSDPHLWPSKIRVSLYSMYDGPFATAAVRASRRCVSVQVLMNNHLNASNDFAWARIQNALGSKVRADGHDRRSFAHRCNYGCRGSGVLHTKMYLFTSKLAAPSESRNKVMYTTMVGSSNLTSNASTIQWNDLYTVKNYEPLYDQFNDQFNLMKKDNGFHRNKTYPTVGPYNATFWPVASGRGDPEIGALKSIGCRGATGGTGTHGHTLVRINMHAWFGLRGLAFVRAVRSLYSRGCTVKILYSFMTPRVYYRLHHGTGSRMSLRRTIFSTNGDKYADVYSHFKNIMASGNVGGDSSSRVVWTGSNNFTPDGTHFDEVMLRIKDGGAYKQYVDRFNYITRRKSSSRYASFLEPVGGGRAPAQTMAAQLGTDAFAPSTPVVLSPDVVVDEDGTPHALD